MELWSYHFFFQDGLEVSLQLSEANLKPVFGRVAGVELSILGFGERDHHLTRGFDATELEFKLGTPELRIQPDIWIRDLEIEAGETRRRTVAFPSGKLLIRAYDETGVELIGDNVFIYVYAAGERSKPVVVARSGELLTLTEGDYDIHAEDTRRENEVRWLERIRLRSGLISEQSVTF